MYTNFEFTESNKVDVKGVQVQIKRTKLNSGDYKVQFFINDELQVQDRTESKEFKDVVGIVEDNDSKDKELDFIEEAISDWGNYMMILVDKCQICGNIKVCKPLKDCEIIDFPKFARSPICPDCKEKLFDGGYFKGGVNHDKMQIEK